MATTQRMSRPGPLRTFEVRLRAEACARKAAGGYPSALNCGSCGALRAASLALLGLAAPPRNSLRSLRSLRSDSLGEFDVTRRAARAGRKPCAARRRRFAPPGTRPRLCNPPTSLWEGSRRPGVEPARRHDARLRRAARAGSMPAARRKPLPKLDCGCSAPTQACLTARRGGRRSAVVVPAGAGPIRGRLIGGKAAPALKRQRSRTAVRARERGPEHAGTATALPQPNTARQRNAAKRTMKVSNGPRTDSLAAATEPG